jgi:hypothetical protein
MHDKTYWKPHTQWIYIISTSLEGNLFVCDIQNAIAFESLETLLKYLKDEYPGKHRKFAKKLKEVFKKQKETIYFSSEDWYDEIPMNDQHFDIIRVPLNQKK